MKHRWLWVATVALVAGGCGQKGPLYLPDKNAKVVTTPAPPSPGSAPASAPEPGATQPAVPPKTKPNDQDQDSQPQPPK